MYYVEVVFEYLGSLAEADVAWGICNLFNAWAHNGQILDADKPAVFGKSCCRLVVPCPERTSLHSRHANTWVRKSLSELSSHGLRKPKVKLLGRGLESSVADRCHRPTSYILETNYLSIESPLRCGEHFLPVPLYRIPPTPEADSSYSDILRWQEDWKSCDQLQMACGFGERWATKQISDPKSALSITGREICSHIETLTRVPTYYSLYRGSGRSSAAERKRPCPSCGKKWLLDHPLHNRFDFKCDHCRLVSNIAWSVR